MSVEALSGRSLYSEGTPQPGQRLRNDPGEVVLHGYTAGDLPFGRLVGPFVIQTDGQRLFAPITDATTKSDGISCFSWDAVKAAGTQDIEGEFKYSANEAVGVLNRGNIVMECAEDLALDNTALTVVNGAGSSGTDDEIGMLAQTTGDGYSTTTGLRLIRKISATLAEVKVDGPIVLVAGS